MVLFTLGIIFPVNVSLSEEGHEGHDHKSHEKKVEAKQDEHGHGDHDDHGEEGPIQLTSESQVLAKIRTMPIKQSVFSKRISVVGKAAQDPEETVYVAPDVDIQIKECKGVLGSVVLKDDILCVGITHDGKPFEVKAPINGTIMAQLAKPGNWASAVTPIFAIADLNKIGANFDVYEKDSRQASLGQTVLVYAQLYPEKVFKGRIVFVSPRMDETSNTLRIKVLVYNEEQLLKLGMNLRGEIIANVEGKKYLTISAQALQTVEGKTVVFVKTAADKFEPKEVKVLQQDKDNIAIEGDVHANDEVVIEGSFILKSQMMESEMEHAHSH